MEKVSGGVVQQLSFTSVHSSFTVADWEAAGPILAELVERTRKNEKSGCIFCEWSRRGADLFCREAYGSPEAVAKHVENVAPCAEALLRDAATLTRTQVHGTLLNLN